jgi:hypothetical protein
MTNYSTSLQQLAILTWQSLCRNRPTHSQVQQHVRNPISWSQLLYTNLCRQTLGCCSGYPGEILFPLTYKCGTGTQTIISWGLHRFFKKTRDKSNPHDLVYNLDSNEYLSMSCAIRVKTSQFVLAHYFSLSNKNKQLNASICLMYYK